LRIFSGDANPVLAKKIAAYLGQDLGNIEKYPFSDGELYVKYEENIRGKDVFLVQSTQPPAENIMQLLLMIDAAKRASAARITTVIPYFGYARQDRKDKPRVAIGAKLMADILVAAGADRVLTMDLHAAQIQGFFNIPFDHIYASAVVIPYFRELALPKLTVLAPDIGSIKMARAYASRLNGELAVIDKRRIGPNKIQVMNLIGDVADRNVLVVDDLVDTAGTVTEAVKTARAHNARSVRCACTHPILSGPAMEKIMEAEIEEFVVTDTVPLHDGVDERVFRVLSVSDVFGEAIKRIHEEESLSTLFVSAEEDEEKQEDKNEEI
jgi:ribose-phosphate pyrophosphokinase